MEEAYFERTGYRYDSVGQGTFKHAASQASAILVTRETQTLNIRFKPVVETMDKETSTADFHQTDFNRTRDIKNSGLTGECKNIYL